MSTFQSETARNLISLSPSVRAIEGSLGPGRLVSAWDIVKMLLRDHRDYVLPDLRADLLARSGPPRGRVQTATAWLEAAERQLKPDVSELHGRLLIVALSRLDPDLEQFLEGVGFLTAIRTGIKEPIESLLTDVGSQDTKGESSDPAPWQLDSPTAVDRLGRSGFARALALRLDRIWNDYSSSAVHGSFALQLHGSWGAGKTSLLNLLCDELKPPQVPRRTAGKVQSRDRDTAQMASRWVVVEFNAWQHQRLDPPWWFLMDAIYRQARAQLRTRRGGWWRSLWLLLSETCWRSFTRRRDIVNVLALSLLGLGILCFLLPWAAAAKPEWVPEWLSYLAFGPKADDTGKTAKAFSAVIALLSTLLSTALLLSRSLLSGSARAAQAFVQSGSDPMEHISGHFSRLVKRIGHPILIMIDDLDRCQGSYVVHLLEGIQTLFPNPRVFYLIAADRRWLQASFEKQYDQFATAITEPGRQLGALFLEKAFELSVALPRLSSEVQRAYWKHLLGGSPLALADDDGSFRETAREEFTRADSEHKVVALLGRKDPDPDRQQVRRQAAIERLASVRVEQTTQYFLKDFAHLLEPNPRAMKRLLNAYAVQRDFAVLGELEEVLANVDMRKKLVLWTIICMRWPALEDLLIELAAGRKDETSPILGSLRPEETPPNLRSLLASDPVQKVLSGDGVGASLDFKSIYMLAGLRTTDTRTGGTVA